MGKRRMRNGKGKVERKIEKDVKGDSGHKIFLQTIKMGSEDIYSEFYIVDLDKDDVVKCPHVLEKEGGLSSMVALGSWIYLIGGFDEGEIQGQGQGQGHGGTSYLDLNNQVEGWRSAPPLKALNSRSYMPCSVAFCGKIYVFQYGECFCPKLNQWAKLPPPPGVDYFPPSRPFLTDSSNNRLLLHFEDLNYLYAYYPAHSRWELLAENFSLWTSRVVFYNGVLFFYLPSYVPCPDSEYNVIYAAYDVATKRWLNVLLSSPFDPKVRKFPFKAFLNFGNGIMCLATYSPPSIEPHYTSLYTVLFKIHRNTCQDVLVTPISAKDHIIDDTCPFANYLAIW